MKFERPIFVLEAEAPEAESPLNVSNTEATSTYSEVWTTWLQSNV